MTGIDVSQAVQADSCAPVRARTPVNYVHLQQPGKLQILRER